VRRHRAKVLFVRDPPEWLLGTGNKEEPAVKNRCRICRVSLALVAAGLFLPTLVMAEDEAGSASDTWRWDASIYAYGPSIGGTTDFPSGSGSTVSISASQILQSLNLAAMAAINVHKGEWGAFGDLIYVNLGASRTASRDFSLGDVGLPAGAAADLHLGVKAWVWTLAAEYQVVNDPRLTVDLLVGARYLDFAESLNWSLTGNLGPIFTPVRSGSTEAGTALWDAIAGVKGRALLGASSSWSVPFYLDGGGGDSSHTWQAAAGIAYAFHWGDVTAMWRYLDYGFSGKSVNSANFNGPLLGATFHW
jgi:hypothetical protein